MLFFSWNQRDTVVLKKVFLKAPSYLTSPGHLITFCHRFLVLIAFVSSLLYVAYKYGNEPNQEETIGANSTQVTKRSRELFVAARIFFLFLCEMSNKNHKRRSQELCPQPCRSRTVWISRTLPVFPGAAGFCPVSCCISGYLQWM